MARPPDKEGGEVRYQLYLPDTIRTRLKILAIQRGSTLEREMNAALVAYLAAADREMAGQS
jgi:hypothetical protein